MLSSGGTFASASRMASPERHCRKSRISFSRLKSSWCSMPAPFFSIRNGTASMRKPDTPSCSQKPMIFWISARTYGCQVFRSGWWS